MNAQQRTRQMQAIHIQFKRHQADGVLAFDTCHLWASSVIGRVISTLDACSDFELNYLRDCLNGKQPKLLDKIRRVQVCAGIRDLGAWMQAVAKSEANAWLRGFAQPEDMPVSKQYRLLKMMEARTR